MTREEATRLVRDGGPIGGVYKSYDEALVDSLSALGILKLDEPRSAAPRNQILPARVTEALRAGGISEIYGYEIMDALHAAGLRITER